MILAILCDDGKTVWGVVNHDPKKDPRPENSIECDDSVVAGMIWDGRQFLPEPEKTAPKTIQEQINELAARVTELEKNKMNKVV